MRRAKGAARRLKSPWRLTIKQEADYVLVYDNVIDRHGCGDTLPEAMRDYWDTVFEYWNCLRPNPTTLGGRCVKDLERMNEAFLSE